MRSKLERNAGITLAALLLAGAPALPVFAGQDEAESAAATKSESVTPAPAEGVASEPASGPAHSISAVGGSGGADLSATDSGMADIATQLEEILSGTPQSGKPASGLASGARARAGQSGPTGTVSSSSSFPGQAQDSFAGNGDSAVSIDTENPAPEVVNRAGIMVTLPRRQFVAQDMNNEKGGYLGVQESESELRAIPSSAHQ